MFITPIELYSTYKYNKTNKIVNSNDRNSNHFLILQPFLTLVYVANH